MFLRLRTTWARASSSFSLEPPSSWLMPREPRFDILFEPVRIGPVVAKNRFFQVPHCNGMGHARPRAHAAMRGVKAEGGWADVSTEEVEIPPSSAISPYTKVRF